MSTAAFGDALLGQIARDGASAELGSDPAPSPQADRAVELLRAASGRDDTELDLALRDWDEAGALHDPEALDSILAALGGGRSFFTAFRGRKLRRSARGALAGTSRPGTLRLACAILGAFGDRMDVAALEVVAVHPSLTLHGATALANLHHPDAYAALLRLLSRTEAEPRVIVIDRLLALTGHAVVRLALLRDALPGLPEPLAREVAPDISERCDAAGIAADERQAEDVRAGAREVLRLAGDAHHL